MKLDIEQIKSISFGNIGTYEEDGILYFKRMTDKTKDAFIKEQEKFGSRAHASCGMRFDLDTDSQYIDIKIEGCKSTSSREFYWFDLYVDGVLRLHDGSESVKENDRCELYLKLDGKKHRVQLFFPFSARAGIGSVELSDGAEFSRHEPKYTAVCYGDSITHGYDAYFPSMSYVNVMARRMDVEVYNQAIGGAVFNAGVPDKLPGVTPDFITVAYGTNDWHKFGANEKVFDECDGFLDNIKEQWGDVPVFVILPIYRGDLDTEEREESFWSFRMLLADVCRMHGVNIIESEDFVPHFKEFYSPDFLHPNDYGFYRYGHRLCDVIEEAL